MKRSIPSILLMVVVVFPGTVLADFSDVESGDAYYDAISYVKVNGIVQGYEGGTYKPERELTRAEFTRILIGSRFDSNEIVGSDCFLDIGTQWHAKYICTAKVNGIISGYEDGALKPNNTISFMEAAKIIVIAFGYEDTGGNNWYEPYLYV